MSVIGLGKDIQLLNSRFSNYVARKASLLYFQVLYNKAKYKNHPIAIDSKIADSISFYKFLDLILELSIILSGNLKRFQKVVCDYLQRSLESSLGLYFLTLHQGYPLSMFRLVGYVTSRYHVTSGYFATSRCYATSRYHVTYHVTSSNLQILRSLQIVRNRQILYNRYMLRYYYKIRNQSGLLRPQGRPRAQGPLEGRVAPRLQSKKLKINISRTI